MYYRVSDFTHIYMYDKPAIKIPFAHMHKKIKLLNDCMTVEGRGVYNAIHGKKNCTN